MLCCDFMLISYRTFFLGPFRQREPSKCICFGIFIPSDVSFINLLCTDYYTYLFAVISNSYIIHDVMGHKVLFLGHDLIHYFEILVYHKDARTDELCFSMNVL